MGYMTFMIRIQPKLKTEERQLIKINEKSYQNGHGEITQESQWTIISFPTNHQLMIYYYLHFVPSLPGKRAIIRQNYDACRRQIHRPISKKEQAHHSSAGGKSVSCCLRKADLPKTVARRLRGGGIYARRPVVCVSLTRQHHTARLQWCREHHNWTEQDWACELFSEESRFSLSSDCRRQLIWRESGTAYRPENIQGKGPISNMQYHGVGRHHDQWPHAPTCGCEWDYDGPTIH
ncbi:transposable element Tcb1 transposase [Trichonephila clavipes]|nr:transposable element Tcb1 transposase [Trichonephila clavipes]